MCGITGIHFKDPDNRPFGRKKIDRFVNELLLGIEHRGTDATGLVVVDKNGAVTLDKRAVTAKTFVTQRKRLPYGARTILGHTRFATQGLPSNNDNNHPVQYRSCYAIHNGHISNDSELFKEFSLERNAEVDSEIIPALFANFGLDKAHLALQPLMGNMAVAVVDPERFPGQLILAKGWSSPLNYIETADVIVWSSEMTAIQAAAKIVLDVDIRVGDVQSLFAGDILYVDKDKVEPLQFKCEYTTTKKKKSWGTYVTARSDREKRRWNKECTNCGHEGLWHGWAQPYTEGACFHNRTENNVRFECKCLEFQEAAVAALSPVREPYDWCDGCHFEFPMSELAELPSAPGTVLLCKEKCLAGSGTTSTRMNWADREEAIHKETLRLMSRTTGDTEAFIGWLLFECSSSIIDDSKSDFLRKKFEALDPLYVSAEAVVRESFKQKGSKGEIVEDVELDAEAEAHLLDIKLEGQCGIRVFDEVEVLA
jgi:hypothetical protein